MTVPSLRWSAARLDASEPTVLLSIENSQITVVLFAIVAAENKQLFVVEGRGVVLDLGRLVGHVSALNSFILLLAFLRLTYQDPSKLLLSTRP